MKSTKRIASLLLAIAMVFAMAISVSALNEIAEDGSILIKDNESVKASEKTFEAYKILDLKAYANDEGEIITHDYTVPASLVDFYANRYNLDAATLSDAEFAAKVRDGIEAEGDLYAFARAAADACTEAAFTGAAVENGYQFSQLPLGYYAIVDTTAQGEGAAPVSAILLDTITPDVEIEIKADMPVIEKKIDDDNDLNTTEDRVDANDAAIGDTLTYVLTSKVPDMTGYDKYFFIVKDQMSKGLTYTNEMVVKVGDKVLAENEYILTETVNEDGTTDLKIVFVNFLQYNTADYVGKAVEVTYTAQLNKDAEINPVPNTNEVYLQYSNNPEVDYSGENEPDEDDENQGKAPLGETPKDKVETYTTALEIIKTDVNGNRLEGAEFSITGETLNVVRVEKEVFTLSENGTYWLLKNGTYTLTDPNGENVEQETYASLTDKYSKETVVTYEERQGEVLTITTTVGKDGVIRFEGLPAGTYTVKETKAPEGYNSLKDELEVVISWDPDTYEYDFDGAVEVDGIGRITIVNQLGSELPETGGIGTTVFYIVGGLLLVAALVILVSRKRMAA